MRVLVVIRRSPTQRYLVELHTDKLVKEVSKLLARHRNSKAIVTALSKGRFDREILENEANKIDADVIITEEGVHWDLMKK